MSTGPVTKSGKVLVDVAVREGKLDILKYLVNEQGVVINCES